MSSPLTLGPARSLVVAAIAVTLVLAACTTTDSEGSTVADESQPAAESEAPESAAESEAPESAAAGGEATVLVASSDLGDILTDADGLTIYYFANDTEGVSNCDADCLANWPVVEVEGEPTAGEGVDAELGTFERSDGTVQLTVNGFPAYYFAGDSGAGDVNGQAVGDVWWVFGPDGEPIEG